MPDELLDVAARRELNRVLRAERGAGCATDHAHLWANNGGRILLVIKSVDATPARRYAQAAAGAAVSNDCGMPHDLISRNLVPQSNFVVTHVYTPIRNSECSVALPHPWTSVSLVIP